MVLTTCSFGQTIQEDPSEVESTHEELVSLEIHSPRSHEWNIGVCCGDAGGAGGAGGSGKLVIKLLPCF